MPRVSIAALIILTLSACAGVSAPAGSADPRAAAAETELRALEAEGFAGSVLVACGPDVVLRGDYGVEVPAGVEPSYWVASITKQFTAAAILALAEEGRLSLDDPIEAFFPDAPADRADITLFQLLTHQSGLPQSYAADGVADRDEAVRAILATPLEFETGARFGYSNDNYSLLAAIIELVSGRSYEDYLADRLFARAGLQSYGFWPQADAAVPALLETLDGPTARANWGFRGGVGARVSAADLHRWARALDTGAVLSAESVATLYGPHVRTQSGLEVGFNWFWETDEEGRALLWTRGSEGYGGNAVLYRVVDTPLIVIAATNAGPPEDDGPGWSRRARDVLLEIYAQPGETACAAER